MATASRISLSQDHRGVASVNEIPAGSIEAADRLLQQNHDENHMFWRAVAGHNHITHSLLTTLALGGGVEEIQRAFDDGNDIQRPIPQVDNRIVEQLRNPDHFRAKIGQLDQYSNFLAFFTQEIETKGYRFVVAEYCFSGSPNAETLFAQLFEGLYHPIIHLAFGIEFDQPSIIAEALAQVASHDSMGIEEFLVRSQEEAQGSTQPARPLMHLFHDIEESETLQKAAHGFHDGPARIREGVLGSHGEEIRALASQFRVHPENIDRRLAEVTNCSAYIAGAAQRAGKPRKIDFFHLHLLTASLAVAIVVRQPWISAELKARLVEWKARVDLVWYTGTGAVEILLENLLKYSPTVSVDMDWKNLYRAVTLEHDDGHLAKFVRALKFGEDISKPFEEGEGKEDFPIKGESWLRLAQMSYDTTFNRPIELKWIWGIGFDENWTYLLSQES
ncbi:hypothetical protein N7462_000564 [Penicillium macrosclerotiorum]|uniref:uncharacterized protein n=1 Tax=Penicillium macrosclerotiorum TaxID=303699 RepID=UPI0025492F25|nr:uncharacterized protein N7462_000564 [Penicillium macrosclerotiorum]KAJ5698559.1 hypothetical protein N7462_000564 [Penicillium macrosclerotiorum]